MPQEGLAAGGRPIGRHRAEGEFAKATIGEVLDGQPHHRVVMGVDPRERIGGQHPPEKHDRPRGPSPFRRQGLLAEPRDHPLPAPAGQPVGGRIVEPPLVDRDRPVSPLVQPGGDTLEHPPSVGLGGLDHERYLPRADRLSRGRRIAAGGDSRTADHASTCSDVFR